MSSVIISTFKRFYSLLPVYKFINIMFCCYCNFNSMPSSIIKQFKFFIGNFIKTSIPQSTSNCAALYLIAIYVEFQYSIIRYTLSISILSTSRFKLKISFYRYYIVLHWVFHLFSRYLWLDYYWTRRQSTKRIE